MHELEQKNINKKMKKKLSEQMKLFQKDSSASKPNFLSILGSKKKDEDKKEPPKV